MTQQIQSMKSNLAKSLIASFESCKQNDKLETLTDLYVQVNTISNEVAIYDDEEEMLTRFSFVSEELDSDSEESVYEVMSSILREMVDSANFEENIASYELVRPFSLLVVDENFEHQGEVYILDSGEVVVEDSLFAGMDKELDDFLNQLLEE